MTNPLRIIDRLIASGIARRDQIVGCTEEEIQKILDSCKMNLPKSYVDFLRTLGKTAGEFMKDLDIYYDKMIGLNKLASEILDDWEHGGLLLPEKAFVFTMRYGEQFMFFEVDDATQDPEIYHYFEGHGEFRKICDSLWDFLDNELQLLEAIYKKHNGHPRI